MDTLEQRIIAFESSQDRTNWVRVHMPNLGPYTDENPRHCVNCGRHGEWELSEACHNQGDATTAAAHTAP